VVGIDENGFNTIDMVLPPAAPPPGSAAAMQERLARQAPADLGF
jgi:hypothetical protein